MIRWHQRRRPRIGIASGTKTDGQSWINNHTKDIWWIIVDKQHTKHVIKWSCGAIARWCPWIKFLFGTNLLISQKHHSLNRHNHVRLSPNDWFADCYWPIEEYTSSYFFRTIKRLATCMCIPFSLREWQHHQMRKNIWIHGYSWDIPSRYL